MFYATLLGGLVSIFNWKPISNIDLFWLICAGSSGFLAQIFMTNAYRFASVATLTPMKYLESVFAVSIGWIWFGELLNFWSIIGIALIIGGLILNVLLKSNTKKV